MLKKLVGLVLIFFLSVSLTIVTGCTKYASQDDLKNLEAAKVAATSAEKETQEVRKERMELEKKLAEKKAELQKAEQELNNIQNP